MSFNIDEHNIKELVEQGIWGVVRQGCRSFRSEFGGCMYRHTDNPEIRCVVGHMIPDEVYDPSMEGDGVFNLDLEIGINLRELLDTVQYYHDRTPTDVNYVGGFLDGIGNDDQLPQWVKDIATKVKQEVDSDQNQRT